MAYQPPISFTSFNNANKPKKIDEDLLGLGYSTSKSTVIKKNDSVSNRKKGQSLYNPDDIIDSFGNESGRLNNSRNLGNEIDFDDNDEIVKESTSLLNSKSQQSITINPSNQYQSK